MVEQPPRKKLLEEGSQFLLVVGGLKPSAHWVESLAVTLALCRLVHFVVLLLVYGLGSDTHCLQ